MSPLLRYWCVLVFTWLGYHVWVWLGVCSPGILQCFLDDVLVVPLVMGLSLWVQRQWVSPLAVFSRSMVLWVWCYFTVVFECIFPRLHPSYTSDWLDSVAYLAGAVIFDGLLNKPVKA